MSKETPVAATAKTKSVPRKRVLKYALVALAVLVLVLPYFLIRPAGTAQLRTGGRTYRLEKATTDAAREKGLGGRESLPADRGMLFVFDTPGSWCFWMKDTRMPLDMIWLDEGKKVLHVESGVAPSTYPDKEFCGKPGAKYVIELNSGEAAHSGITTGKVLDLQ